MTLSGADIASARAWAAGRPKAAPDPTSLHLDFIRASEAEDCLRAHEPAIMSLLRAHWVASEAPPAVAPRPMSITDSLISPLAKRATQVLLVRESQVRAFRSLSASICLAQTLAIGLAYEQERLEAGRRKRLKKA